MLYFVVTLVFVVCNLFCAVVKWCYIPDAYKAKAEQLFPCRRQISLLFGLQILQIPYLISIDDPLALTYANICTLLAFSSMIPVLERRYFMLDKFSTKVSLLYFLPAIITIGTALWMMVSGNDGTSWPIATALAVFTGYLGVWTIVQQKIYRRLKLEDEEEYSNDDDFPSAYARLVQWAPLILYVAQLSCLLSHSQLIKCIHDGLLTVMLIWLLINSLNPKRTGVSRIVCDTSKKHKMSRQKASETEEAIIGIVTSQKMFTDSHLTLLQIAEALNTNQTYISEAISRGRYGTFYNLINSIRIDYAISLLKSNSNLKIETVAIDSGFSSNSVFSRTFKRIIGKTPSQYLSSESGKD